MFICCWCGAGFDHKTDLMNHNAKDTQCHKKSFDWSRNSLFKSADLTPTALDEARKAMNLWSLR